jgi:hypothetical protein
MQPLLLAVGFGGFTGHCHPGLFQLGATEDMELVWSGDRQLLPSLSSLLCQLRNRASDSF